jgi:hypothetical protein
MINSRGQKIYYTAEGKRKDPKTWAILNKQAWDVRRAKGRGTSKDPAGNRLPGSSGYKGPSGLGNISAGAGGSYYDIPPDIQSAIRTGRTGGVTLSQRERQELAQQYALPGQERFTVQGLKFDGQSLTADAAVEKFTQLYRTNPRQFALIQQRLFERGYFGEAKKVAFGVMEPDTISAFEKALGVATLTGDLDQVLYGQLTPAQQAALRSQQEEELERVNPYDVENTMGVLRDYANDYLVPVSDPVLRKWAHDIVQGQLQQPTVG